MSSDYLLDFGYLRAATAESRYSDRKDRSLRQRKLCEKPQVILIGIQNIYLLSIQDTADLCS
jgi:hypothetical protein